MRKKELLAQIENLERRYAALLQRIEVLEVDRPQWSYTARPKPKDYWPNPFWGPGVTYPLITPTRPTDPIRLTPFEFECTEPTFAGA